jgi:hypothetical protein
MIEEMTEEITIEEMITEEMIIEEMNVEDFILIAVVSLKSFHLFTHNS